jgi:hypothetical protein
MTLSFPSTASDFSAAVAAGSGPFTVTLNKPANTADGDVLVAVLIARSDVPGIPSPSASWTSLISTTSAANANGSCAVYYLPVPTASAAAASWAWSFATNARAQGILFRVVGANTSSPINQAGGFVTGGTDFGNNSPANPTVAPTISNTSGYMLFYGSFWTETAPTGVTTTPSMTLLATGTTPSAGVGRSALGIWTSTSTTASISQQIDWETNQITGAAISFATVVPSGPTLNMVGLV